MISMRFRPRLFAGAVLGAFGLRSPLATAQQSTPAPSTSPSPPTQPASGPGGADYAYDEVVVSRLYAEDAHGEARGIGYWLFEPAAPRTSAPPPDTPLPLVLFLVGGMDGIDPEFSYGWIDHLVRRGAIVIFPRVWSISDIDEVVEQVTAALAELDNGDHVPVDLNRVAVVGQGLGGPVAARLAVMPPEGLSVPTALMVVTPDILGSERPSSLPDDLASLPAITHVLLVGTESAPDERASSSLSDLDDAWTALVQADRVPAERRAYVVLRGDAHGSPALVASEFVALTAYDLPDQPDPNALDWYGTWKFLDGLMGCAFTGEWCEYAFGNTPEQRFMGVWSDGVPVAEAIVVNERGESESTPAR